ncbi:type II toxin-antitoxin system PemK/MazF family toxin [Zoogloea dura]|uniref:Type II toxin-antitoxin system PemK/MazF family toxin n=1 Tax=Zoogloea dura TaxID=2728840 RepID=A0A848FZ88_9RHOO|nr:type II toxin-antitoxin system PemK/MazF family toxin [Zoogloea dura]NML24342.1 type II toxin-antitoxin system PemK/MazF family toxin [Zoogloea dura]
MVDSSSNQQQVSQNFNPLPAPGDILWCRFPEAVSTPGPKSRPALVVAVAPEYHSVTVAYGTSQKTTKIYPTEFLMDPKDKGFPESGLFFRTKFDMKNRVKLPFNDEWFDVAPGGTPTSPPPKMGVMHPSYHRAAKAANDAC